MTTLKFGKGNAKLGKRVWTFSLPAGRTCPGADICKSMAVMRNGKVTIKDGPNTVFRCFAASDETRYKNTYSARQHNLMALRGLSISGMASLISTSLPKRAEYVRVHVSGDFFNQTYFAAWMKVARENPKTIFYAYTKSLNYWVKYSEKSSIPSNFILTASVGGRYDNLIAAHNLRYARVVYSQSEADNLSLPIDHDDSHAMKPMGNFALLIHGTQPKGSDSAKALVKLRKAGVKGYSK